MSGTRATAKDPRIVYFGTSEFSVDAFARLLTHGIRPALVITTPDKPKGRGNVMTPPPVKLWAESIHAPVLQPGSLRTPPFSETLRAAAGERGWDACILASYGKILPAELLSVSRTGILNIHPSLLPKYRGASPVQSAILADDKDTGVTIIKLDEGMDHGPILAKRAPPLPSWPLPARALATILAQAGADAVAELLPSVLAGTAQETPQDDAMATFTRKFESADGEISLTGDARKNYLRFLALSRSPGVFFFHRRNGKDVRLKITDATLAEDGAFVPTRVVPEGRKEMPYADFLRGIRPEER